MSIHVSDIGARTAVFTPRPTATPHNAAMAAQVLDAQTYADAARIVTDLKHLAERLKKQPGREAQAFMAERTHQLADDFLKSLTA